METIALNIDVKLIEVALYYVYIHQVCFHDGLELSSPEDRDAITGSVTKSRVSSFIGQHFKGVSMDPTIMEVCMYTNTVSREDAQNNYTFITHVLMYLISNLDNLLVLVIVCIFLLVKA